MIVMLTNISLSYITFEIRAKRLEEEAEKKRLEEAAAE